jgi:hypothetical protein
MSSWIRTRTLWPSASIRRSTTSRCGPRGTPALRGIRDHAGRDPPVAPDQGTRLVVATPGGGVRECDRVDPTTTDQCGHHDAAAQREARRPRNLPAALHASGDTGSPVIGSSVTVVCVEVNRYLGCRMAFVAQAAAEQPDLAGGHPAPGRLRRRRPQDDVGLRTWSHISSFAWKSSSSVDIAFPTQSWTIPCHICFCGISCHTKSIPLPFASTIFIRWSRLVTVGMARSHNSFECRDDQPCCLVRPVRGSRRQALATRPPILGWSYRLDRLRH